MELPFGRRKRLAAEAARHELYKAQRLAEIETWKKDNPELFAYESAAVEKIKDYTNALLAGKRAEPGLIKPVLENVTEKESVFLFYMRADEPTVLIQERHWPATRTEMILEKHSPFLGFQADLSSALGHRIEVRQHKEYYVVDPVDDGVLPSKMLEVIETAFAEDLRASGQ